MNLTASDVMNKDVITFQQHNSVREAFEIIANENFSGAPVVNEDDELIGVVTEKDLLKFPCRDQYDQQIPYIRM